MKSKFITILFLLLSSFAYSQYGSLIAEGKKGEIVYKIYSQHNHFYEFSQGITNDSITNYDIWEKSIYNKTREYWSIGLKNEKDTIAAKKELFEYHLKIKNNVGALKMTKLYEKEIEKLLIKTFQYFNSEKDTVSVILVPIDYQGGTVKEISERNSIMPIGVNLLKTVSMLKSIVPHEFTHRYNGLKGGIPVDDETWVKKAKMYWSLWGEGLATYGTGIVTGDFSTTNLMLQSQYKTFVIDKKLESWLANQFLKQYSDALINFENDKPRAKWFASNSTDLRKDLPPAIGYYLGYLVVNYSIENLGYTFDELLSMKPKKLRKIGNKVLKKIAKNYYQQR